MTCIRCSACSSQRPRDGSRPSTGGSPTSTGRRRSRCGRLFHRSCLHLLPAHRGRVASSSPRRFRCGPQPRGPRQDHRSPRCLRGHRRHLGTNGPRRGIEPSRASRSRAAPPCPNTHVRSGRVCVLGDARGLVTLADGLAGRTELSVEAVEHRQGTGAGSQLITEGLRMVSAGEPVFAAVSPGNARSLRAFLAAGFVPIGSEVVIQTAATGGASERPAS